MSLRRGFILGRWTVYPLEGRLYADGQDRRVQPKSMDVLLALAEAQGEVVEREELLHQIWGERAVSDEPLTRCIGDLRRALDDTRHDARYILTVPKRGYRLLLNVSELPGKSTNYTEGNLPELTTSEKALRFITWRKVAGGLAVLVVAALVQIGVERILQAPDSEAVPVSNSPVLNARSIAVLPFLDLSPAGDQEYMSNGIAEEILNLLTKIEGLRVLSRSSSFSLQGQPVNVRSISERFNVAYILEGSVRTSADDIRVTAQLIDARTDDHVWSETYDRNSGDVFAIQEEIAQAVAGKLEVTLQPGTAAARQTDPRAYALYLQARAFHEKQTGDAFVHAHEYYKAALEIDESYVPAWVWLAALYDDTLFDPTVDNLGLSKDEAVQLAFEAIDRALTIDPDDPLALGMSAVLISAWEDDPQTVVQQMQRAVNLDPSNAILLRWAVIVMTELGQHEEAVRVGEYLLAQDPIGKITKLNLASIYLMAGRYAEAVRLCEVQITLEEELGPCSSRLIVGYINLGNAEAAKPHLELARDTLVYTRLAPMVYYSLGSLDEYEAALADLQRAYEEGDRGNAYWLARTYNFTQDIDKAFEWIDQARRDGAIFVTPTLSYFANLHADPRWQELLEKVGKGPDRMGGMTITVKLPGYQH